MKDVEIDKKKYQVNDDEYVDIVNKEFYNLKILDKLGHQERIMGLLKEVNHVLLMSTIKKYTRLLSVGVSHGGYMEIELSKSLYRIVVVGGTDDQNLQVNMKRYGVQNIEVVDDDDNSMEEFAYIRNTQETLIPRLEKMKVVVVENCPSLVMAAGKKKYILSRSGVEVAIWVALDFDSIFQMYFQHYLVEKSDVLAYDNLIHYALMVKNGGDTMREVIRENMKYIDEYTILDTGSTDNTVQILREELDRHKKRGKIVTEPFINFRDSRNRCLDLCGTRCKYIVMLDDTYIVRDNLRLFLEKVRGDQFSDSFSMYILSEDVEYGSNRIIRTDRKHLRYKYKIHEVITPENNNNVIIPKEYAYIHDLRSDYMEERTMNRKEYDIKILNEMAEEDKNDSRVYYYLGQTYNLLERYEEAFDNFVKRAYHKDEGFLQEKIDAIFEAGRLANFQLKKPWVEAERLYLWAYELDKSRPDALYFIGIHYYLEKDYNKAYRYFAEAYHVGYPFHCQYSLKPSLSYYYLPKFLVEVCYHLGDHFLGFDVCTFFLNHFQKREGNWWKKLNQDMLEVDGYTMQCWQKIFFYTKWGVQVKQKKEEVQSGVVEIKRRLVFIVNGGFVAWRGSSIEKDGTGGSETFIIEMSKAIKKGGLYDEVIVFCNCGGKEGEEEYCGVLYKDLSGYIGYLNDHSVDRVVVSRYPEYLASLYEMENVKEVSLILHDLIPSGEVILRHEKLKKIMLLSEYHKTVFDNMFGPILGDLTSSFGYGIDVAGMEKVMMGSGNNKVKNRFIYSSTANRGLIYLLMMWRGIKEKIADATLYIHCDIYNNKWLNETCKEEMDTVREMMEVMIGEKKWGIVYKGWVSKKELYQSWGEADVWFYPTTFLETYCLTALEAGISKTLAVTMPIGSLVEVVGDRGILLNKNVTTEEGRGEILKALLSVLGNEELRTSCVERNYEYTKKLTWAERSRFF
jgi:tetratricopeptide (TPR) repeat protein